MGADVILIVFVLVPQFVGNTGKYRTWTPGPWTPSVGPVHGPGPSKYGPGPWSPHFSYP